METFEEKGMVTYKEKVAAYHCISSSVLKITEGTPTLSNDISSALSMLILSNSPGLSAAIGSNVEIMVETPRMTATEVLKRSQEKSMLLTPLVARQQNESLTALSMLILSNSPGLSAALGSNVLIT
jgi:hypothetical protein